MALASIGDTARFLHDSSAPTGHSLQMMIQTTNNFQATKLDLDLSDSPNGADLKLLGTSDVHMTVNPSFPGKQHGHLVLPVIHHNSVQQQLRVPVCMIEGVKKGPTVTLLAGIHGDEFEGTLTLQRMARTLSPDSIAGRLIIVPSVNLPGLKQGSRISPLDDLDLDRCFPGNPNGSISERLAYEVFERLVKPADLIVDLRSGGRDLVFAPSAAIRFSTDTRHQAISEAAMIAFGAPNSVRLPASGPNSCLQAAVNASGRHYVQTELGGGAGISVETLAIAATGCNNILRHWGSLSDDMELRASRMLEVRDESFYVYSTTAGLLEPHGKLGQEVWQGDVLANIIDLENTGSKAHSVNVPRNSVLLATRRGGSVMAGELIAILADEVHC